VIGCCSVQYCNDGEEHHLRWLLNREIGIVYSVRRRRVQLLCVYYATQQKVKAPTNNPTIISYNNCLSPKPQQRQILDQSNSSSHKLGQLK
jgi:hypothetical protein